MGKEQFTEFARLIISPEDEENADKYAKGLIRLIKLVQEGDRKDVCGDYLDYMERKTHLAFRSGFMD